MYEKFARLQTSITRNRWHCASGKGRGKKKWLVLKCISHDDFDTNVMFFSVRPIIYFLVQPFLLTIIPLCIFLFDRHM